MVVYQQQVGALGEPSDYGFGLQVSSTSSARTRGGLNPVSAKSSSGPRAG